MTIYPPSSTPPGAPPGSDYHSGVPNGNASQASAWGPPWTHNLPYNSKVRCKTELDGSCHTYDPLVSVRMFSHRFGTFRAEGPGSTIDHHADQYSKFVVGGSTEAIGGHSDSTIRGACRENYSHDHYCHVQGASLYASLQGQAHFNPGNQAHYIGGSHMITTPMDGSAMGLAQGGGGTQNPPNRLLLTQNQTTFASVKANMSIGSSAGNVGHEATAGNMKMNAMAGKMNVNGQQTFINGQTTQINGTSQVVIGSSGGMPCPMTIFQNGITITAANGPKGDVSPVTQISQGAG